MAERLIITAALARFAINDHRGASRLAIQVHGQTKEVSAALLRRELSRSGPPPALPLVEAVIFCGGYGEREPAIARLRDMLAHLPAQLRPGDHHVAMRAAQGLMQLRAADAASLGALAAFAARLGGAAGAAVEAGTILLRDGPGALAQRSGPVLRQSPRAVCAALAGAAGAGGLPGVPVLCAAWAADLRGQQRALGVQALRAYVGDVAEALYRLARRGYGLRALLGEADCTYLLELTTGELPGTSDFLAARPMVWLLGLLGPPDDATVAAIERARDRFANEEFHADCAAILTGQPWPPPE